jgi:hypothetical protein
VAKLPQSVWLVERTGPRAPGQYQAFVCFSISERQARYTDPVTGQILFARNEFPPYWSGNPSTFRVTRLGIAIPNLRKIMGLSVIFAAYRCKEGCIEQIPAYKEHYVACPDKCNCNEHCDWTCGCPCHARS